MFLSKIILSTVLVFITAFSAHAQKPAAKDWSIADYFKNLPEKYRTFSGDFSPLSKDSTYIDEENGYAAYFEPEQPGTSSFAQKSPIFEMALFKSETKPPLVVVSNRISDSVCIEYQTFFLRRVGSKWTEVKREVLPPLNLKMFWSPPNAAQSAARLLKIVKETAISYHFDPPRVGRSMKVSLEICNFLEDDAPEATVKELEKLIGSATSVRLSWDSGRGEFKRWLPKGNWKPPVVKNDSP